MAATLKLVCALVACILVTAPMTHALTCGQVTGSLAPCIGYLRQPPGTPPPACCSGVRSLNSLASTPADRQAACKCLKSAAGQITNINPSTASALPGACGVNIPYKISTSTDCSKVK